MVLNYIVDQREHAAILAGLRLLQHYLDGTQPLHDGIQDIRDDMQTLTPLNPQEINHLCERINTS